MHNQKYLHIYLFRKYNLHVYWCINECQFSTFEGLPTTFEGSLNVFYNATYFGSYLAIGAHEPKSYNMHTKYVFFI